MEIFKSIKASEVYEMWNNCRNMNISFAHQDIELVFKKVNEYIQVNKYLIKEDDKSGTGWTIFFRDKHSLICEENYNDWKPSYLGTPWGRLIRDTGTYMAKSLWISFEESRDNEERQIFVKWFIDEFKPDKIEIER